MAYHSQSPTDTVKIPSPRAVNNYRSRYRRSVEERFGKTWKTLGVELKEFLGSMPRERHSRINASPQRMAVMEMILADHGLPRIGRFLRRSDPERFSDEQIGNGALRKELQRFRDDLIIIASQNSEDAPTPFHDLYRRLPDGSLDIEKQMIRVVLMQEARLGRALRDENRKPRGLLRSTSREFQAYSRFLMSYAVYHLLQQPCGERQKEWIHQMMMVWRRNIPR